MDNLTLPKWDNKRKGGLFMSLLLLGGLGFAFYVLVLPWLLTIVWGTIQLVIGAVVGFILLTIVGNKKFWRALRYLCEGLAQGMLGWAIEMNPFLVLEQDLDDQVEDVEKMRKESIKLKAEQSKLRDEVNANDLLMRESRTQGEMLQKRLSALMAVKEEDRDDAEIEEVQLQMTTAISNFNNAKDYIDAVKPNLDGISTLIVFFDKAYRRAGVQIENIRSGIRTASAIHRSTTTALSAMNRARNVFLGRPENKQPVEMALLAIHKQVAANKAGINDSLRTTTQLMNFNDIKDAAKVQLAVEAAKKFDLDKAFRYSDTVTGTNDMTSGVAKPTAGNKYLTDFLTKK